MGSNNYILQIPKPCHENWQNMVPDGNGRFCANCAKNVIDFTRWTDEEIVAYIEKQDGNLCGRLNDTQLNRTLQRAKERKLRQNKLQGFLAGLLMLLTTGSATAGKTYPASIEITEPNVIKTEPLVSDTDTANQSNAKEINGKVIDSKTKEPVPFANVINENSKKKTLTNFDGKFSIRGSREDTITITSIWYKGKTIIIKIASDTLIVPLERDSSISNNPSFLVGQIAMSSKIIGKNFFTPSLNNKSLEAPVQKVGLTHKIRHIFKRKRNKSIEDKRDQ